MAVGHKQKCFDPQTHSFKTFEATFNTSNFGAMFPKSQNSHHDQSTTALGHLIGFTIIFPDPRSTKRPRLASQVRCHSRAIGPNINESTSPWMESQHDGEHIGRCNSNINNVIPSKKTNMSQSVLASDPWQLLLGLLLTQDSGSDSCTEILK